MGSIILQITQYIDCTWRIQKYSSMSNNADESQKCMVCLYIVSFHSLLLFTCLLIALAPTSAANVVVLTVAYHKNTKHK
jgi:hypothetical protein